MSHSIQISRLINQRAGLLNRHGLSRLVQKGLLENNAMWFSSYFLLGDCSGIKTSIRKNIG